VAKVEIGLAIPVELQQYSVIRCGGVCTRSEDQQTIVGQNQRLRPIEFGEGQAAIHAECGVYVAGRINGNDRVTVPDDDAAIGTRAEDSRAIANFQIWDFGESVTVISGIRLAIGQQTLQPRGSPAASVRIPASFREQDPSVGIDCKGRRPPCRVEPSLEYSVSAVPEWEYQLAVAIETQERSMVEDCQRSHEDHVAIRGEGGGLGTERQRLNHDVPVNAEGRDFLPGRIDHANEESVDGSPIRDHEPVTWQR
jgi:hypothetical protein